MARGLHWRGVVLAEELDALGACPPEERRRLEESGAVLSADALIDLGFEP